jgi:hypothetical protein
MKKKEKRKEKKESAGTAAPTRKPGFWDPAEPAHKAWVRDPTGLSPANPAPPPKL